MWSTRPELSRWLPLWKRISRHIEKCDLTRFAIMHLYGGVYVDMDFECCRSINPLMTVGKDTATTTTDSGSSKQAREIALVRDLNVHKEWRKPGMVKIINGYLMSRKGHPLWAGLMDEIAAHYSPKANVMFNTGPTRFALYVASLGVSERTHPDWFVDKCLIVPWGRGGKLITECRNHPELNTSLKGGGGKGPYARTRWDEGSTWTAEAKSEWRNKYLGVVGKGGLGVLLGAVLMAVIVGVVLVSVAILASRSCSGGGRSRLKSNKTQRPPALSLLQG